MVENGCLIPKKILVVSQYDFPIERRNQNFYQRLFYGSQYSDIYLILRRGQICSDELKKKITIEYAPFSNRVLYFFYIVYFALLGRFRGFRLIFTDGSVFSILGFVLKFLLGYFWVMDIWDRPRWQPGQHQPGDPVSLANRAIFWMMGFADLYLLSVLPPAAQDIKLRPERCAQFFNCLDLAECAQEPPARPDDDPTLHVAFGRARFDHTIGVRTVVAAAEALAKEQRRIVFHVVGRLTDDLKALIESSPAANLFQIHGFIKESRREFYSRMHVGLCPYDAYQDNSFIFPIKVLEHLSQGNPVIVSRLPGLCAMVQEGYNGLTIDAGDAHQLASALTRLQDDRELWRRLAANALESIKKYDVRKKNRDMFHAVAEHFARWQARTRAGA